MKIRSNLIDIPNRRIFPASITIENGIIASIQEINLPLNTYMLPGFVDAHVHIESSLLVPSEFARMAVIHGTVATVSDPHEIANVMGMEGVDFMIRNGRNAPFHFFFGAPSCVPATAFETAGDVLNADDVAELLKRDEILYLSEMMNFPGVLHDDAEVLRKITAAHAAGKPVDGHAPALSGDALKKYVNAGISTDHECFTLNEALEKIAIGMKVIIREGSAARNFNDLIPLMREHSHMLMFCSDDKHPDNLLLGHINQLAARAIEAGHDLYDVLRSACINPVEHYRLPVGLLRPGDPADFIITSDLNSFRVDQTWIKGKLVAENGVSFISSVPVTPVNRFNTSTKKPADFARNPRATEEVIICLDGQLVTDRVTVKAEDLTPENDCLKIVVVNRYSDAPPAVSWIRNFGLKQGAIASSVAHDSHNVIATGVSDEAICEAVNLVIANKGGLSAVGKKNGSGTKLVLPLPVAGLMSDRDAWEVAAAYTDLHNFSIDVLGSTLKAPFMSLSFMALLVIPHLKLSDKGLFDGDSFSFVH